MAISQIGQRRPLNLMSFIGRYIWILRCARSLNVTQSMNISGILRFLLWCLRRAAYSRRNRRSKAAITPMLTRRRRQRRRHVAAIRKRSCVFCAGTRTHTLSLERSVRASYQTRPPQRAGVVSRRFCCDAGCGTTATNCQACCDFQRQPELLYASTSQLRAAIKSGSHLQAAVKC